MMTTVAFLAPFLIWEVKMCSHILRLVHFLLGDKIQISFVKVQLSAKEILINFKQFQLF